MVLVKVKKKYIYTYTIFVYMVECDAGKALSKFSTFENSFRKCKMRKSSWYIKNWCEPVVRAKWILHFEITPRKMPTELNERLPVSWYAVCSIVRWFLQKYTQKKEIVPFRCDCGRYETRTKIPSCRFLSKQRARCCSFSGSKVGYSWLPSAIICCLQL